MPTQATIGFQPALPMRGVTATTETVAITCRFQPALPMRGVTLKDSVVTLLIRFQPALPMRGVTVLDVQKLVSGLISTRTPHAGSDALTSL